MKSLRNILKIEPDKNLKSSMKRRKKDYKECREIFMIFVKNQPIST